ncbi:MAG: DEAD/DEAH box helicase [Magnetococcales bacterium]|nr:DEAD/DEAH box helicase [Magnetococcales bacterium]
MDLTELPIPEAVMAGIRACGFTSSTPIQEMTLPLTLAGRDVAGQAQTGTGKTAAYLIGCFSRLITHPLPAHRDRPESPGKSYPRMLVIAPTRELAVQIERDALALGAHTGFKIVAVYGGVDYERQQQLLAAGDATILIGTPGRLIDYLKQKIYSCSRVEALVIDEADRMFDMGFIADLRFILRRLPPAEERISMLFSATLSYRAQEMSYEFMDNPLVISATPDTRTAESVVQQLFHVEGKQKISLLVGILRRDLAEEGDAPGGRVMIFVNTKRMGEKLERWLEKNGISAGYLSGDVPQAKRLKVLQRFQEGKMPVLIATDVAGRGLHIQGVTHVINFDMPDNPEDYIHRIGRTARAGASGDAISLVDEEGAYNLEAIEKAAGMKIPVSWPEESLFAELMAPPYQPPSERLSYRPGRGGEGGRSGRGGRSGSSGPPGRSGRSGSGERSGNRRSAAGSQDPGGEGARSRAESDATGPRQGRTPGARQPSPERSPSPGEGDVAVGMAGSGEDAATSGEGLGGPGDGPEKSRGRKPRRRSSSRRRTGAAAAGDGGDGAVVAPGGDAGGDGPAAETSPGPDAAPGEGGGEQPRRRAASRRRRRKGSASARPAGAADPSSGSSPPAPPSSND